MVDLLEITPINPSLIELLDYNNPFILDRYRKDYSASRMTAEDAFHELVKYMWLCHQHKIDQRNSNDPELNFRCAMHKEMREIDHMWHTFLLFTEDYHDFCMLHFGSFFHHRPLTDDEKHLPDHRYEIELQRYLTYIYDKLGEATLVKWFGECLGK